VQHLQSDELEGPRELGAWMSQRGLLCRAPNHPAMFDTALQLRSSVRTYLEIDPAERRKAGDSVRSPQQGDEAVPAGAEARNDASWRCGPGVTMPWPGCRSSSPKMYDGSVKRTLGRLKMCAAEVPAGVFRSVEAGDARWCMSTLCGNRTKTRAYRERQLRGRLRLRSTRLTPSSLSVNHWPTRSFLSSDQPTVKASRIARPQAR